MFDEWNAGCLAERVRSALTASVRKRNERAGMPRWALVIDRHFALHVRDVGEVLLGAREGANGLGVVWMESGSYDPTGSRDGVPDCKIVVWPDAGVLRVSVVGNRPDRCEAAWSAFMEDDLFGAVLTGTHFDCVMAKLRARLGCTAAAERWVNVWVSDYDELLARLALVLWANAHPGWKLTAPFAPPERELLWIGEHQLPLVRYAHQLLEGAAFTVVAVAGDHGLELRRAPIGGHEDQPRLKAFDWTPCPLTEETYDRLVHEVNELLEIGSDVDLTWAGLSYADVRARFCVARELV